MKKTPAPARIDQFGPGVHGPADARREVLLVVVDQRPPSSAVARRLDVGREPDGRVLVEVALADAHQHRMRDEVRRPGSPVSLNGR
jgi:hypothetical protein